MFSLILENENGDTLNFQQNTALTVVEIQGLNPPTANINTSEVSLMDGGKYNSAKLNMRTLDIAFAIEYSAPYNRVQIYKVLKSKQWIRMYYQGDYRNVFIDGYIQSIDITYFEKKQIVTVSILCPSPYFKNAQEIISELANIIKAFHFPFASTEAPQLLMGYIDTVANVSIPNTGDVSTGLTIELYAKNTLSNPKIYNYVTQEYIGVNFSMEAGDLITITTAQGNKSITLLRNGVETNIFNSLMKGSDWLQLEAGGSTFVYELGTGNLTDLLVTFKHYNLYEGV